MFVLEVLSTISFPLFSQGHPSLLWLKPSHPSLPWLKPGHPSLPWFRPGHPPLPCFRPWHYFLRPRAQAPGGESQKSENITPERRPGQKDDNPYDEITYFPAPGTPQNRQILNVFLKVAFGRPLGASICVGFGRFGGPLGGRLAPKRGPETEPKK